MAKRTVPTGPAPKITQSPQSLRMGIERLSTRIKELEAFDPATMRDGRPPELIALETAIQRSLEKTFGEGTADCRRFSAASALHYSPTIFIAGQPTPLSTYRESTAKKRQNALALLGEAVRTLKEDLAEMAGETDEDLPTSAAVASASKPHKVFIVHGHDEGTRAIVKSFIEKLGFEAVVLHERPNKGRTIITKFQEEAADIGFAVVLMTPDDQGSKAGSATMTPRARQNVVFELGFFYGALGAARVVALVKGEIEKPSDFDGVVYISLDSGNWQTDLGRELKAAGFPIDWNKVHA